MWVLLAGIILCSREAEFQSQSIAGQRAELGMDFFFPSVWVSFNLLLSIVNSIQFTTINE